MLLFNEKILNIFLIFSISSYDSCIPNENKQNNNNNY